MVTLTYIDAYQVERTTTYTDLCGLYPSIFRLCNLPDSYSIVSIEYKGDTLYRTSRWTPMPF